MILILMSINIKIKFTGRYFLVTSPSTAIPERLPIKNICEISFHIFLYCFHNYHHYDSHYEKHSYDCQNPDNPYFPTCICYFLVKSIIISCDFLMSLGLNVSLIILFCVHISTTITFYFLSFFQLIVLSNI